MREPDGLAMSSRNGYLTPEERARAPALYRALLRAGERLRPGWPSPRSSSRRRGRSPRPGFGPDYVSVRRAADLASGGGEDRELVVLAAARLGRARLIDNCASGARIAAASH